MEAILAAFVLIGIPVICIISAITERNPYFLLMAAPFILFWALIIDLARSDIKDDRKVDQFLHDNLLRCEYKYQPMLDAIDRSDLDDYLKEKVRSKLDGRAHW